MRSSSTATMCSPAPAPSPQGAKARAQQDHPEQSKTINQPCTVLCLVAELNLTLGHLMDCSPPSSSVHGILQARTLGCVATPSSRGSSQPRDHSKWILYQRSHQRRWGGGGGRRGIVDRTTTTSGYNFSSIRLAEI